MLSLNRLKYIIFYKRILSIMLLNVTDLSYTFFLILFCNLILPNNILKPLSFILHKQIIFYLQKTKLFIFIIFTCSISLL